MKNHYGLKETTTFVQRGKVLVMDDEKLVRDVAGRMLQRIGYNVDCVKNGQEAINRYKIAEQSNQPFDAVFIDLHIHGGMGGEETIKILKKIDPGINAIVASSDIYNPLMTNFKRYGFVGALAKPFNIMDLLSALKHVNMAC